MTKELDYGSLSTESRNPLTQDLDQLDALSIVRLMNEEDEKVPKAIRETLPVVARAAERAADAIRSGGRLIYVGAGTSGRLGVLDASECPPTFQTSPDQVVGVMAGGDLALRDAVEGAEDDAEAGCRAMQDLKVDARDCVVGLSASGTAPYVVAALTEARRAGAATFCIVCNPRTPLAAAAENSMEVGVGPEVITGSTRLKAGTAQKLILNMISTAAMVRLGKVYGNLMVDLSATNRKLRDRARRIVMEATGCSSEMALEALNQAKDETKVAIVMLLCGVHAQMARERLAKAKGGVRDAIQEKPGTA